MKHHQTATWQASNIPTLRQADARDIPAIWHIILQAKAQMAREGRRQWDEHYPSIAHIEADINNGQAYVSDNPQAEDGLEAYAAVVCGEEPAYRTLSDGTWLSRKQPYVVVHRLAVADSCKHRGVATRFMLAVEDLARLWGVESIKVDTNHDNLYMQHLLGHLGYSYRGQITYDRGVRMGYEKLVE